MRKVKHLKHYRGRKVRARRTRKGGREVQGQVAEPVDLEGVRDSQGNEETLFESPESETPGEFPCVHEDDSRREEPAS